MQEFLQMAVNLHAFITETNGALYVHVSRKEPCDLYILNYVDSELFQMKPFDTKQSSNISYCIGHFKGDIIQNVATKHEDLFFIVDTISLPNFENVNFQNTV